MQGPGFDLVAALDRLIHPARYRIPRPAEPDEKLYITHHHTIDGASAIFHRHTTILRRHPLLLWDAHPELVA